ncbi:MAG: hypothetical protein K2L88_06980 [Clostridiales bacterium]|nr:hypothetical protein [Clostridiales bacterium]
MDKKQAQNYINKVGKGYKLPTRKMNCIPHIYLFAALLVVLLVLCNTAPMVIISCALFVALIVFLAVTVRRYMSMLRLSAYFCGINLIWIVMLNCLAFAVSYHESAFVLWGFCTSVAIQAVLFVVTFATIAVYTDNALRKKIILISAGVAAVACSALAQSLAYVTVPNSAPQVLAFVVLFGVVAGLLAMCCATFAARIYLMRKHDISYKPEWKNIDDFCNHARFNGLYAHRLPLNMYTVYCFEYKSYVLYIYSKCGGKSKLLVFDNDALIVKEKYKNIDALFANAEIDHYKLSKIWGSVKPI